MIINFGNYPSNSPLDYLTLGKFGTGAGIRLRKILLALLTLSKINGL